MRPSRRASDANSSSYLYCSCCGLPNSNVQDGCSMTPSSDMNSLTISLRIVISPHFIAKASPLGSMFVISLRRGKRSHHRHEPFDAVHHADVRRTWQDGKLSAWQTMQVAGHTTSQQTEHLHRVLGLHDVGVSDNQECRHCDRVKVGARYAAPVPVKLHRFLDQSVPVLRAWSNARVILLERGSVEHVGRHRVLGLCHICIEAARVE